MPTFSIIVPVYNGEKYISKFCDCLQNQIFKNFEVVFVNDGSTDNSLLLLKQEEEKLGVGVLIINQNNQGVSAARNAGIVASKGEYICFCDIDDIISNDYLYFFDKALNDRKIDLAICGIKNVFEGVELKDNNKSTKITYVGAERLLTDYINVNIPHACYASAIHRNVIIDNNLRFAVNYKYCEDTHFMWMVLAMTRVAAIVEKEMYLYVWHSGTAMSNFSEERLRGFDLIKKLGDFLYVNRPDHFILFCKHGPSRLMWSLLRQASAVMEYSEFVNFFSAYDVKKEMKQLYSFPNIFVRISAYIYNRSTKLFYFLSKWIGSKTVHK